MTTFAKLIITPVASAGNSSPITMTLNSDDYPDAEAAINQAVKLGGINADDGNFYPMSAILFLKVSL